MEKTKKMKMSHKIHIFVAFIVEKFPEKQPEGLNFTDQFDILLKEYRNNTNHS